MLGNKMPPPLLRYGGGVAIPPWLEMRSSRVSSLARLPLVFPLRLIDGAPILPFVGKVAVPAVPSGRRMMRLPVLAHHGAFKTVAALDGEIFLLAHAFSPWNLSHSTLRRRCIGQSFVGNLGMAVPFVSISKLTAASSVGDDNHPIGHAVPNAGINIV